MGVRLGLIGVLAAFIAAASVAAETPRALTVRIAQAPGVDRVVLGLSERIAFRAFTLADPARVVVDFPTVDWRLEATRPGPGFVLGAALGPARVRGAGPDPPRTMPTLAASGQE